MSTARRAKRDRISNKDKFNKDKKGCCGCFPFWSSNEPKEAESRYWKTGSLAGEMDDKYGRLIDKQQRDKLKGKEVFVPKTGGCKPGLGKGSK